MPSRRVAHPGMAGASNLCVQTPAGGRVHQVREHSRESRAVRL